jgi:hypothetical protein
LKAVLLGACPFLTAVAVADRWIAHRLVEAARCGMHPATRTAGLELRRPHVAPRATAAEGGYGIRNGGSARKRLSTFSEIRATLLS